MKDLKGIIFDFNGVLFWDSHLHDIAWKDYSNKIRGVPFSDEEMEHKVHGRTNKDILEYLTGRTIEGNELLKHVDGKESIYRKLCLERKHEFKLAPGAIAFLDYLKNASKPITIATASEISNLKFFFKHLDLGNWFDFDLVVYDDGTLKGKPAPDIYLRAAEKLGLKPNECIVIEDSRSGIQSAFNARVGKIVALGPKDKQAILSNLEGVNQTIVDFNDLLRDIDDLWKKLVMQRTEHSPAILDKIIWPQAGTYVVAVSGGVDSVSLLHMLVEFAKNEFKFVVAHFDHGIRGDSARDRQFVEKLAKNYGLAFEYGEGELGPSASEATARQARYEFLQSVQRKHQAAAIITAHHLDDRLETILLNLSRGTGRRGLTPFRNRPGVLRPLQQLYKKEIMDYAKTHKLQWREDPNNALAKHQRNRIRTQVLPQLEAARPGFKNWLVDFMASVEKDNQQIDDLLAGLFKKAANLSHGAVTINRQQLIGMSQSLAQEFVHYTLNQIRPGVDISAAQIKRAVHFCKTAHAGRLLQLNGELQMKAGYDRVTLTPKSSAYTKVTADGSSR